jgi:hypothetical protein
VNGQTVIIGADYLSMPVEDLDIYRSAKGWLERCGDKADTAVKVLAVAAQDEGDLIAVKRWRQILAAIKELQRKAPC